jgi:uracil-DNA glycosylase
MLCRPEGPIPARIMLVGEAPGVDEERVGLPFQGASGQELNRMLSEAGLSRGECFVTNVARERPAGNDINQFFAKSKKERDENPTKFTQHLGRWCVPAVRDGCGLLEREIDMVMPNVIVALGGTSLWALTGIKGITKWRGSMLVHHRTQSKVIPTIHPAAVLREWSWRATVVHDLRRAARFRDGRPYPRPAWRFIVRPTFSQTRGVLLDLLGRLERGENLRLSFDLETRLGHIACAGLSWTLVDAICIPFMQRGKVDGYWEEREETELAYLLMLVLCHKNAEVVGQNILYDAQYTWRHWGYVPRVVQDCMISQHSIFSDLPKSLAFQASMYCDFYVFWKEEGKQI